VKRTFGLRRPRRLLAGALGGLVTFMLEAAVVLSLALVALGVAAIVILLA